MIPKVIKVDWFSNLGKSENIGLILTEKERFGFVYHNKYNGIDIDPIHLKQNTIKRYFPVLNDTTLHGVFRDCLPGFFAENLIIRKYPEYQRLNDVEKLYFLGSRQNNALKFTVLDGLKIKENSISDLGLLDDVIFNITSSSDDYLKDLLNEENFSSLVSNGGARPKVEYEDEHGFWIVKFDMPNDHYDSVSKVEYAVNQATIQANINTAIMELKELENGHALFVKRFDKTLTNRFHKLSLATLTGIENIGWKNKGGDYLDILNVINKISCDKNDCEELYKRMIFSVVVNNTDNHFRNYEMIYDNGYRLSPSYDVLSILGNTNFSTSICYYPMVDVIDHSFVFHTAKKFNIPEEKALIMAQTIVQSCDKIVDYLIDLKATKNDIKMVSQAIKGNTLFSKSFSKFKY